MKSDIHHNRSRPAPWVLIVASVVAMLLLSALAYWIWRSSTMCGPEVARVDDQCIGVSDGRVALSAEIKDVLGKIHAENQRVAHSGQDSVSIAYLVPLPKSPEDKLNELLRHELQGAHTAQLQANKPTTGQPAIRILVANYGDESSQWQRVTRSVLEKVDSSDHLVAAVITGRTLDNTIRAADTLRSGGVPVIASRLTGNKLTFLDEPRSQGLARVAPTNNDQAASVALFLKRSTKSALLVQDSNPEDPYLLSLGDAFRVKFADQEHNILEPAEFYNSQLPGVESQMKRILRNICVQQPDVVFFAGRTPALKAFIAASPQRPCKNVPVRVVAGADAAEFPTEVRNNADLRNFLTTKAGAAEVSVIYTSQAHPGSWSGATESFPPHSMDYLVPDCKGDNCYSILFPEEQMDDGAAIIGHDAVTVVTSAIHSPNGVADTPGLIIQEFNSMRDQGAVPGASGWISLNENGHAVNKAVAILQVNPDGTVTWLGLHSGADRPCVPEDKSRRC